MVCYEAMDHMSSPGGGRGVQLQGDTLELSQKLGHLREEILRVGIGRFAKLFLCVGVEGYDIYLHNQLFLCVGVEGYDIYLHMV